MPTLQPVQLYNTRVYPQLLTFPVTLGTPVFKTFKDGMDPVQCLVLHTLLSMPYVSAKTREKRLKLQSQLRFSRFKKLRKRP